MRPRVGSGAASALGRAFLDGPGRSGNCGNCDGRDVYVVGVDGRGWTPVWRNPKHEPQHRPAFSPDGRYLAIIYVPLNVMNGPGQVLVSDLGRQLMQAVGGPADANSDAPLGWAP